MRDFLNAPRPWRMFRVSPIDTLTARSRGEPSPASLLRVPSVHACGLIGKLARKSADIRGANRREKIPPTVENRHPSDCHTSCII